MNEVDLVDVFLKSSKLNLTKQEIVGSLWLKIDLGNLILFSFQNFKILLK